MARGSSRAPFQPPRFRGAQPAAPMPPTPHLKDLCPHFSWSTLGASPTFPAHRTLSQAKYMALLRWLRVTQKRSTMSDKWMALFAASRASAELPRRSTAGRRGRDQNGGGWGLLHTHTQSPPPPPCRAGAHSRFRPRLRCASSCFTLLSSAGFAPFLRSASPANVHAYCAALRETARPQGPGPGGGHRAEAGPGRGDGGQGPSPREGQRAASGHRGGDAGRPRT